MDATEKMRRALDNIERAALADYIDPEYVLAQIEFARSPVHSTSDAVRAIKEATGCSFDIAFQAYKEGESVEAGIRLVDCWKTREARNAGE